MGVEDLSGQDQEAFLAWLARHVEPLGLEALVTDDLNTYKPMVEELGLGHPLCLAHGRRWVTRRLKAIPGCEAVKGEIREVLRVLWWRTSIPQKLINSPTNYGTIA